MRVYQVNTYVGGGAAVAAMRLNHGLIRSGIDSRFFSPHLAESRGSEGMHPIQFGKSLREKLWRRWRRSQLQRLRSRHQPRPTKFDLFGYDLSCYGMALLEACRGADVVNFHWVSDLLDYPYVLPRLAPNVPVVWTLHDMNPATGGCYYARDCRSFETICGRCPELGSSENLDMSTEIWRRKDRALRKLRAPLALVTPSEWLAGEARRSGLLGRFPVQCIPNGVDVNLFRPRNRCEERGRLGVPRDALLILFVAATMDNPWKGLHFLVEAMPVIREKFPEANFMAVGEEKKGIEWPVPVRVLGAKTEKEMASIYAAADLLVVPSVADNFPNVILEAMACGVPAVGFKIGGIPEAIRDGETGVLAAERTSAGLAEAIVRLLDNVIAHRHRWEHQCRGRALREFALEVQAGRYSSFYRSLLRDISQPFKKGGTVRRASPVSVAHRH